MFSLTMSRVSGLNRESTPRNLNLGVLEPPGGDLGGGGAAPEIKCSRQNVETIVSK